MSCFGAYSQYYDLLYADKDYAAEVDYVCGLLKRYADGKSCSLLELGSGTGVHAELMARNGFSIHGVELSEQMLESARRREKASNSDVRVFQGDARNYRAGQRFDAVISLFHVLSYQTTDDDLGRMLETAAIHLDAGGLFIFDFWYGPAVLRQGPSVRVKRLENEFVSVVRIAEPEMHDTECLVDVNYTIFSEDRKEGRIEKLQETHRMRYFFLHELDAHLERVGFSRLVAEEWLTGALPSTQTWGVTVVCKRIRP
ncbi:class I SAM-dependent DNA methyltransferase [Laribacter hongkongensis]|uniref:class I SAM-dependent DNA methyltransferase n=1 Tax=Laribacter hongkongensis TaxID=168471 RepID=UPI001EFD305A|nr:class I SAM-dependent methyltransferase [Laribacter hongkongensis]MCG9040727.1 class I SAM-dependent methyltransferase [Laribacter hongkongensis]MCG9056237.1 class I SAM-dependent methyltransferase [Laribacter hongkongensis]MCG9067883.1 class I SAM-dependent methyltransferase [Laribacter hongkongensis]